jgi:hypothetical protein
MKIEWDESQAEWSEVVGKLTYTYYPNGSYTVSKDGIYQNVVYRVFYRNENDQEMTGVDQVFFNYDGAEYHVCEVITHDGLSFDYGVIQ